MHITVMKLLSRYGIFVRYVSYIPKGRLNGKVAVVTASTNGIGYSIAERLAQEGAKVVISSRKQKNVDQALAKLKEQNLNIHGIICHVSNQNHRKQLYEEAVKQFGGINILVSNAGVNPSMGGVLECEEKAWDKIFEVNLKCSYLLAKECLPYLKNQGGGKIVFISSIGAFQPFSTLGAYSVSKTSLVGLTKAAALQLAQQNITVNCVAPGIIKTKFSAALRSKDNPNYNEYLNNIPMKKFGTPEDIASAVSFLVSDDANYITGETIIVAGGAPSRL